MSRGLAALGTSAGGVALDLPSCLSGNDAMQSTASRISPIGEGGVLKTETFRREISASPCEYSGIWLTSLDVV